MQKLPESLFKIILYLLRPYFWLWLPLMAIWLVWAIDLSLRPYLIKTMLDKLEWAVGKDVNLFLLLMWPAGGYIGMSFLINFLFRLHDYIETKFFPPFNQHVFLTSLEQVQQHSYKFFQQNLGGSIATRMAQLSDSLQEIVEIAIKRFFSHFIALIIACYTMATVDLLLALILILWVIGFVFATYYFSKEAKFLSHKLSEQHSSLIGKIVDSISNMMIVRLFVRQKYEYSYLATEFNYKTETAQQLRWNNLKRQATIEATSNILLVFLIAYLISARQHNEVTIGDFSLILSLALSIMGTIWNISQDFLHFSACVGRFVQATHLFNNPGTLPIDRAATRTINISSGKIEFNKVSFSYNNDVPLFSDLSLTIKGGQKIGLVGFSGSGKTTFVNLLIRLFDIDQGNILIDGQDIAKVNLESLHQNITFIPQDPMLFHRTIYENIKYGNLDATDEEVKAAIINANAQGFIDEMPEGYNTQVGDKGSKLSGGQRQRIAIARAFLKNSKILILDEPTSALDSLSEYYIQQSLNQLMQGKTVIVIAHRLITLTNMNRILVFENGNIVEDGSHIELLENGGLYYRLWQQQAGRNI